MFQQKSRPCNIFSICRPFKMNLPSINLTETNVKSASRCRSTLYDNINASTITTIKVLTVAFCTLLLLSGELANAAPADGDAPIVGAVANTNLARKWSNGVGLWGKRSAPIIETLNGHARFLAKRPEESWNKLNSLWGKRSGSSWQQANGLWGKRSSVHGFNAPDAERLQTYFNAIRSYILNAQST